MDLKDKQTCGYIAMFESKVLELRAPSLYAAKQAAIAHFKPRRNKEHMVQVFLVERADGSEVIQACD